MSSLLKFVNKKLKIVKSSQKQEETKDNYNNHYSAKQSLFDKYQITIIKKISNTLQGSIYLGKIGNNRQPNNQIIIKRATRSMVKCNVGKYQGKIVKVNENIFSEADILKLITKNNILYSIKLISAFDDGKNIFLIMSYGGESLLNHIKKYYNGIKYNEWIIHGKYIIKQMCLFLSYIHKLGVAHMDISIENICIKNCIFGDNKFVKHGVIRIIDYGCSIKCGDNDKLAGLKQPGIGKINYMAPEVYAGGNYSPFAADIWSLGVTTFVLIFNKFFYNKPCKKDKIFNMIYNKYNMKLFIKNKDSKHLIKFLDTIFVSGGNRPKPGTLINDKWLKN